MENVISNVLNVLANIQVPEKKLQWLNNLSRLRGDKMCRHQYTGFVTLVTKHARVAKRAGIPKRAAGNVTLENELHHL